MHLLIVLHTFQATSWENLFERHVIVGSGVIIFFLKLIDNSSQAKTKKITTVTATRCPLNMNDKHQLQKLHEFIDIIISDRV